MPVLSQSFAQWIGHTFLFCLYGTVFIQSKPSAISTLLGLLIGLFLLTSRSIRANFHTTNFKQSYLIYSAFLVWPIAHLCVAIFHAPISWTNLGNPARTVIAIGIFGFLSFVKTKLSPLYVGIGLACLATFLHTLHDRIFLKLTRSIGWLNNENHYGDYSSLVGIFAIVIGFKDHNLSRFMRYTLCFLGCLALIAAVASGTRAAMLSMVCLLPLLLVTSSDSLQRHLRKIFIVIIASLTVIFTFSERFRSELRYTDALTDFSHMSAGRGQTSIGDRHQMWIAALDMASTSPVWGVGLNKFRVELESRIISKKILPLHELQNQAHSQALHSLATGGIVLLLTYILFVCAPFQWFYQHYRKWNNDTKSQLLAYLGMTTVVCHVVYGLSVAIFDIQIFSSLYFFTLAMQ
jgi:O-antigen ligase